MNLIEAPWLPFRTQYGSIRQGPPATLCDTDIVDLALPRADFQGAAWQLLIGLLQTVMPPRDMEDWLDAWEAPPSPHELGQRLDGWRHAFELLGDGPRFMQELEPMTDARSASIGTLLIEAPGEQGIRYNTDHFVKRGVGSVMCPACAALALLTMQFNAPSGGKGYRTGLRGGGPLTTLVLPRDETEPLWRKLWLNVLPQRTFPFEAPSSDDPRLFPWLGPTRVSDRPGSETLPEDVHPLHAYWSMPRRFRLEADEQPADCRVCGARAQIAVRRVRAKNYGYNYAGHWRHPLTPYRRDPNKPEEPPASRKGQQGGIGYRHWEALALPDSEGRGNLPAQVVEDYVATKYSALRAVGTASRDARLWAFGYDMDNMKPRGWYTTRMPLVALPTESARECLADWVRTLVQAAEKAAWQTRKAVKAAWFARPGDARGDFAFIDQRLWEATEPDFYAAIAQLRAALDAGPAPMPPAVARRWAHALRDKARAIFDDLALSGDTEAIDMKQVTEARRDLGRWLQHGKEMKQLRALASEEETA